MTDNEIKDLAMEVAKTLYGDDSSYDGILWWCDEPKERKTEEIEMVLKVLLRNHCINSKEKVKALEANIHGNIMCAHDDDDWQEVAHYILDVMPRRFIAVFGADIFEERNDK